MTGAERLGPANIIESSEIPEKMWALRKLHEGPGLEYVEVEVPTPGEDEVLVEIASSGICGSDKHIASWEGGQSPKTKLPVTLGHEVGGRIVGLGEGVDPKWLEKGVVLESVLKDLKEEGWYLGINADGGLARYVVVPKEALHKVPEDMPLEKVGALEPATIGLKALRKAKEWAKKNGIDKPTVVIQGATGMIGAVAALASSFYGFETYAVGRRDSAHKLNKIDSKITTVNTKEQDLEDALDGKIPQIIIETIGRSDSLSNAEEIVGDDGIIFNIGLQEVSEEASEEQKAAAIENNSIVREEKTVTLKIGGKTVTLAGVYARDEEDWDFAAENIGTNDGKIDINSLIETRPISEVREAFEDKGDKFKIMLIPNGN